MSEWDTAEFGSLYAVPSKNGIMAPSRVRGAGALLVNMKEIFAYDVISNQAMERAPVPPRAPDSWLLHDGDLLFARQSLTLAGAGKVSLVVAPPEPMTFESHIIRVRLHPDIADSRFYYYLFRSDLGRELVAGIAEQVAAAGIRASDLGRLRVPKPPLDEQLRIAGVLAAFDELIETNRRAVADLRELGLAAFDAASAQGDVVAFSSIATQIRDGVGVSDLIQGAPYLGLEHFAPDGGGISGRGDAGSVGSSKSRFRAGDVLYGKLRPYFRKSDRPGFDGVCSTEIWVLRPRPGWGAATLDAIVGLPEFTEFAMAGSGGTRMPRANWDHVSTMPVAVPCEPTRSVLDAQLERMWRARVVLMEELRDLQRTRDELLTLLMTGKVRVSESLAVA